MTLTDDNRAALVRLLIDGEKLLADLERMIAAHPDGRIRAELERSRDAQIAVLRNTATLLGIDASLRRLSPRQRMSDCNPQDILRQLMKRQAEEDNEL